MIWCRTSMMRAWVGLRVFFQLCCSKQTKVLLAHFVFCCCCCKYDLVEAARTEKSTVGRVSSMYEVTTGRSHGKRGHPPPSSLCVLPSVALPCSSYYFPGGGPTEVFVAPNSKSAVFRYPTVLCGRQQPSCIKDPLLTGRCTVQPCTVVGVVGATQWKQCSGSNWVFWAECWF